MKEFTHVCMHTWMGGYLAAWMDGGEWLKDRQAEGQHVSWDHLLSKPRMPKSLSQGLLLGELTGYAIMPFSGSALKGCQD